MRLQRSWFGLGLLLLALGVWPVAAQPVGGTLRRALIDHNTIATHAIVAAVTAQTIRVYQMTLFCNGANNVTVKDSTPTTLHPVMNFGAGQGMVLDYNPSVPWFTTAAGKSFDVDLSANQQCSGVLWYTQGAG